METTPKRSGFAALIGRPNVGKSSILNRMTGEKLAIVSPKPQTTRHRILGIVNSPKGQIAFVDTPGVHQAKGNLNKYMVDKALHALDDVDIAIFVVEAVEGAGLTPVIGEGNRFIMERLLKANKPTVLVLNKIDAVKKVLLLPLIELYRNEFQFAEVVPTSAKSGDGLELLKDTVLRLVPEGEPMFDPEMLTDQQERQLVSEYIREQVLRHCRQEIPYSTAVTIENFDESEREPKPGQKKKHGLVGLVRIMANIYVERESQKAIVIGKGGTMLKTIGTDARRSIERLLGTHVFLDLRVRVEDRWSERPAAMKKLGYE